MVLEFKTRSTRPKRGADGGAGMRRPLQRGTGLKNIQSAALKKPEVMVKIPPRKGGTNGLAAVRGHLDYISRNGQIDVENQDGFVFQGQKNIRNGVLDSWQALGVPEKSKRREAINLVLSMPPGTNPEAVRLAARVFAREQFDGHQYAFAQHLDEAHPHVHLCVMMKNELGQYMNPRKGELFEWRLRFAEKMREQGWNVRQRAGCIAASLKNRSIPHCAICAGAARFPMSTGSKPSSWHRPSRTARALFTPSCVRKFGLAISSRPSTVRSPKSYIK